MKRYKRGNLYVISGPSGTGKGSICAGLTVRKNVVLSVSMTTRTPRVREAEGLSYYFVNKDIFKEAIDTDMLFEHAEVFGEYYGTPKAPVLANLESGNDVILEIEVKGAMQIKESFPEAILVFILPPSQAELRRRIEGRGTETPEKIDKRLERVAMEIAEINKYDYLVINDDLVSAIEDMFAIMEAEKLRVGDDIEKVIKDYQSNRY